jgi:hypothetical protein
MRKKMARVRGLRWNPVTGDEPDVANTPSCGACGRAQRRRVARRAPSAASSRRFGSRPEATGWKPFLPASHRWLFGFLDGDWWRVPNGEYVEMCGVEPVEDPQVLPGYSARVRAPGSEHRLEVRDRR